MQLNRSYHERLYVGHLKGVLCNILQFDTNTNPCDNDGEDKESNQNSCCLPKQQLEPQLIDLLPSSCDKNTPSPSIPSSSATTTPKTFDVVKSILSNPPSMYSLSNQLDFYHLDHATIKTRPQFFPSDYYTSCLPNDIPVLQDNTIAQDGNTIRNIRQ
eukprot:UN06135